MSAVIATSGRPARLPRPARIGLYVFLATAALAFLLPLYVMVATSMKPMEEIRLGNLFSLPVKITLAPWAQAWMSACTGLECGGIRTGFMNSVAIVVPSTVLSILLGALNGYALSFWRPRGAQALLRGSPHRRLHPVPGDAVPADPRRWPRWACSVPCRVSC